MLQSAAYASWFEGNMRCTKETFLRLGRFLQEHGIRFANTKIRQHSYEKKVAAALYFLGSSGGYREVGAATGMSRSYVKKITDEVIRVLKLVAIQVISFPRDRRRWNTIEDQFALRQGYPGVVGAIDGSLVEIERPDGFDGFYCRKSYPALNIQAIVTMDNYFLSVEMRPGSWSDRKCWQHSVIGRNVFNIISAGTHFVGDAGYALSPCLMVPYSDREEGGTVSVNSFNELKTPLPWLSVLCTRAALNASAMLFSPVPIVIIPSAASSLPRERLPRDFQPRDPHCSSRVLAPSSWYHLPCAAAGNCQTTGNGWKHH
eukprot:jgi/Phyca11/126503/e_gw1.63.88.1